MAKVNMAAVRVAVAKDTSGRMKAAAQERAEQVFADAVIGMQIDFEEHPVTRELDGGITSDNISNTLGGGQAPKNLYSFIGFPKGSRPTDEIRDALMPEDPDGPKFRYRRKEIRNGNARFLFEVSEPNRVRIHKRTPMPWARGLSWAQKVETRIPGFGRFLNRFMPLADDAVSRSKGGTQLKVEIRGEEYTPPLTGYLTGIFARFLGQVRSYQLRGFKRRFGQ